MSKIEWTQATWNPLAGCSIVSPGCHHCYAMTMARRLAAMGHQKYAGTVDEQGRWSGQINLDQAALLLPLKRHKPTMYFVNSMSDLFHEAVPTEFIDQVVAVMALCGQHTFQVLTKRAERMHQYTTAEGLADRLYTAIERVADEAELGDWLFDGLPLPHVWLGVSAEDQTRWNQRVPWLAKTPAAVRFVSAEPLLGPIDPRVPFEPDYEAWSDATCAHDGWEEPEEFIEECEDEGDWINFGRDLVHSSEHREWLHDRKRYAKLLAFRGAIDWLIVGGESGADARPLHPQWVRELRDACHGEYAPVAFFFKQWGAWAPSEYHPLVRETLPWSETTMHRRYQGMCRVGKKAAGRELDGRTWDELPAGMNVPE